MVPELVHEVCFSFNNGTVDWDGCRVDEPEAFHQYLAGPVKSRLADREQAETLESDLRALATTEMATDTLDKLLSEQTSPNSWEVGEALAECLLTDNLGAHWPSNTERDKRTPKASLPGADLIGFVTDGEKILFLLGEVKTSSEAKSPPQVVTKQDGLIAQLNRLSTDLPIHRSLLNWLHARCKNTASWPLFQEATENYLASERKHLILAGLLMRDTAPDEKDLASPAATLADCIESPTSAKLQAWYFPSPASEWPALLMGDSA